MPTSRSVRAWTIYAVVWGLMALPLLFDLWRMSSMGPGHEAANLDTGRWAWRFLLLSLAIRPAAQMLRLPMLLRYRRMVGLFGFAYAMIHSLDYVIYAQAWNIPFRVWVRRLYLWVGIAATLALIPLAVTSFDGLRRGMGPVAWRWLHRSLYAVGLMVAVHALWEDLTDYTQSIVCTALLMLLLVLRLPAGQQLILKLQGPRRAPAPAPVGG